MSVSIRTGGCRINFAGKSAGGEQFIGTPYFVSVTCYDPSDTTASREGRIDMPHSPGTMVEHAMSALAGALFDLQAASS